MNMDVKLTRNGLVMIKLMWKLDCSKGFPEIQLNTISIVSVRMFPENIRICISRLRKEPAFFSVAKCHSVHWEPKQNKRTEKGWILSVFPNAWAGTLFFSCTWTTTFAIVTLGSQAFRLEVELHDKVDFFLVIVVQRNKINMAHVKSHLLAHMILKAKKPHDLTSASCRPRKALLWVQTSENQRN